MLSLLLQRGALRATPISLPLRTGAAAAAAQRAGLAHVELDARRTFLTSPLSLAAAATAVSKLTKTATATGAKKSASKSTVTAKGKPKAKKSTTPTGMKTNTAKRPKPKKETPPKRLTASELPPKGPPGPWNLFLAKHLRENRVKAANVVEAREMRRQSFQQASAAWRSLSDAEKKPYYEQCETAKVECIKRRAEYFTNAPDELISRLNLARKKKGRRTIGRRHTAYKTGTVGPRSSYNFFIRNYFRNNHRDESVNVYDFVKQAAAVWNGMSETERAPFAELARKDLERYRQETATSD